MLSKISIDVDDQGLSTITISVPKSYERISDVRDKLVKRFLKSGMFALITRVGDNNDAEIHSMGALDILANIRDIYGSLCEDSDMAKEFHSAVGKFASLLSVISGEKSASFSDTVQLEETVNFVRIRK